jgi:hypothetical protein
MNWLRKLLGYHGNEYYGSDFSVRIEQGFREVVSIFYTRGGTAHKLGGERIGKKWEGISIHIPHAVEAAWASQIARDLEIAFRAMRYGYEIVRVAAVDSVPETERQAALAELREMGYEIEVSADRSQIREARLPGAPHLNIEAARKQAPRMMQLLQAVHGTRPRFEILAKSNEL